MRNHAAVVLAFVVVAVATAQTAKELQPAKQPTAAAAAQSHVGRYQIFFSPLARADVYLLDTETGKIWKPITITNAKDTNLRAAPEVWVYQERIDSEGEFDLWMMTHKAPADTQPPPSQ